MATYWPPKVHLVKNKLGCFLIPASHCLQSLETHVIFVAAIPCSLGIPLPLYNEYPCMVMCLLYNKSGISIAVSFPSVAGQPWEIPQPLCCIAVSAVSGILVHLLLESLCLPQRHFYNVLWCLGLGGWSAWNSRVVGVSSWGLLCQIMGSVLLILTHPIL